MSFADVENRCELPHPHSPAAASSSPCDTQPRALSLTRTKPWGQLTSSICTCLWCGSATKKWRQQPERESLSYGALTRTSWCNGKREERQENRITKMLRECSFPYPMIQPFLSIQITSNSGR
jgi:hypothetical protein